MITITLTPKTYTTGSAIGHTITMGAEGGTDSTPPSTPTGLHAAAGDGHVSLSWHASTDNTGVTEYNVYRDGTNIHTGSSTQFNDTTVSNGTTYSYRVSALDAANNESAHSAAVSATPSEAAHRVIV